ncbi:HAUS augmin-like complex subunit 7 [Saccoglossus kowalevskii]|uniref:Uncharacterized protein LOC100376061 n=1 Tax=Saccoglossus kowalevskii TaxID=10224 RepID=A0ABM0GPT2_SACKO|nr:PREDICTED: uncharacterized protein LOC100376061 [Saccoglossus kowalevskii]
MAAISRREKFVAISQSFRSRLEEVNCPFVEDVDDSWIMEHIFTPGEQRIRLLQWLFSRFDPHLTELFDSQCIPSDTKIDSRLQRLLYVSSILGLCNPNDVELVRGNTSKSKQIDFIDQLIDMVYISETSEDVSKRAMSSPGLIDESVSLPEQVNHDCNLLETIVRQENMNALFSVKTSLLPPDLTKNMRTSMKELGYGPDQRYELPQTYKLECLSEELAKQLIRSTAHLKELHACPEYDESVVKKVIKTTELVSSELAQLVTGFTFTFENEMRPWCGRSPPILSDIGVSFKRVYTLLQNFMQTLQSFSMIKTSVNSILKSQKDVDIPQEAEMIDRFKECVQILNDLSSSQQEKRY